MPVHAGTFRRFTLGDPAEGAEPARSTLAPVCRIQKWRAALRERTRLIAGIAWWLVRDRDPAGSGSLTASGVRVFPICAECRLVRNRRGDWAPVPPGWWPRPHVLSHGLCPACLGRASEIPFPIDWVRLAGSEGVALITSSRTGEAA